MTEHRPPGRRRYLSDQEIDLWLQVVRDIPRLPGIGLPQRSEPAAPAAPPPKSGESAPQRSPAARPAVTAPPPLAPLDRRQRQRIARGKVEIAAAIDLHGLHEAQAHAALIGFLRRAQSDGARLVLVVTGKGRASGPDPAGFGRDIGVLRRAVPHWLRALELRGLVLGFEEAAVPHGGAGALYVRLRRPGRGRHEDSPR
jgi:DNA-nicking Smr family endonuclease